MPSSRDLGIICGNLPPGRNNDICDVPGVRVGHCTLQSGDINTGSLPSCLTPAISFAKGHGCEPCDQWFRQEHRLVQLDELGALETPILLTNTLSVGSCASRARAPRTCAQSGYRPHHLDGEPGGS